jgi:hypothetical protein
MADDHDGRRVETRPTGYRGPLSVSLLVGAIVAVIVSNIAWDICEVNCTFARQKALMYLALPAGAAALLAVAVTRSRRIVWGIAFGIAAALLCAWLVAALVISP